MGKKSNKCALLRHSFNWTDFQIKRMLFSIFFSCCDFSCEFPFSSVFFYCQMLKCTRVEIDLTEEFAAIDIRLKWATVNVKWIFVCKPTIKCRIVYNAIATFRPNRFSKRSTAHSNSQHTATNRRKTTFQNTFGMLVRENQNKTITKCTKVCIYAWAQWEKRP